MRRVGSGTAMIAAHRVEVGSRNDATRVWLASARGSALVSVTLIVFLFSAIAVGAAIVVRVEVTVAERYRQSVDALYAAQGALAVAMGELRAIPEWAPIAAGTVSSPRSDGTFVGTKTVPSGGTVDVCCGSGSAFGRLLMESRASPHPLRRTLAWHPYLWTTFDALAPRDPPSRLYVVVFVAEDDEDIRRASPGDTNGILLLRAEAIAPGGLHRTVEALLARRAVNDEEAQEGSTAETTVSTPPGIGVLVWREVR